MGARVLERADPPGRRRRATGPPRTRSVWGRLYDRAYLATATAFVRFAGPITMIVPNIGMVLVEPAAVWVLVAVVLIGGFAAAAWAVMRWAVARRRHRRAAPDRADATGTGGARTARPPASTKGTP